jgi:hypothetical protein
MYSQELRDKVIDLRRQNKSIRDIALEVGKTNAAIRTFLSKNKILKYDQKKTTIDLLSSEELAYIAGIIDGEGSIIISKQKPNKKKGEINIRYQLFCKVVNTDKRLIEYLSKKTGQLIFSEKTRDNKINCRNTFSIHWPVKVTTYLLKKIRDYLVIKKEQVDLAVKFIDTFHGCGHTDADKNIMQLREECYIEMKMLHRREFI